jgi:ligand-binding sensor domain-containing protein
MNPTSKPLFLFCFSFFFSVTLSLAQDQCWDYIPNSHYVSTIVEEDTVMWVSTYGKVVTMDKKTKKIVQTFNLKNSPIEGAADIFIDSQKRKWMATGKDVYLYDNQTWSLILSNVGASQVFYDEQEGSVWVGTPKGIYRRKNGIWFHYTAQNIPIAADALVTTIVKDAKGAIWFGTKLYYSYDCTMCGLIRYNPIEDEWKSFGKGNSTIKGNTVNDAITDQNGNIWSTAPEGLMEYNVSADSFLFHSIPKSYFFSVAVSAQNDIITGADYNMYVLEQQKQLITYPLPNLGNNLFDNFNAIAADKEGRIWYATNQSFSVKEGSVFINLTDNLRSSILDGVSFYAKSPDSSYWAIHSHGVLRLNQQNKWQVCPDSAAIYWVKNETINTLLPIEGNRAFIFTTVTNNHRETALNKIYLHDGKTRILVDTFSTPPFLGGDFCCLYYLPSNFQYAKGKVYFGDGMLGLWEYNPKTHKTLQLYTQKDVSTIATIQKDKKDNLWILSSDTLGTTLYLYDGLNLKNWEKETNLKLPSKYVGFLFFDQKDNLWMSGDSLSLYRLENNQTWVKEAYNLGEPSKNWSHVQSMAQSIDGTIWLFAYDFYKKTSQGWTKIVNLANNHYGNLLPIQEKLYAYNSLHTSIYTPNCDVVTAEETPYTSPSIRIYPNPTSDYLTVELPAFFDGSLQLINVLGETILQKHLPSTDATNLLELDLRGIATGTYWIVYLDKKQVYRASRFVRF